MSKKRPLPPVPPNPKPQDTDSYEVPVSRTKEHTYASLRSSIGDEERKILVSNLPTDSGVKETLELYFESKKHFGRQLTVESVEVDTIKRQAIITFEDTNDAKHVLETHMTAPCELRGSQLKIELYREESSKNSSGSIASFGDYSDSYESVGKPDTIQVRGNFEDINEDTLELYFENTRSGGGTIKKCSLDKNNMTALITFEDPSVVERVLRKKHELRNCKLTVQLFSPKEPASAASRQASGDTDTIEVRGFTDDTTEDTLRYYFENERRSGGGEMKAFTLKRDEGFALITFKDPSVIERVQRKEHTLKGCKLLVKPFIVSKNEIILMEVPEHVSEEIIENFLEAKLHVQIIGVVFNADKSKVLVRAASPLDIEKVKMICNAYQISGTNVVPLQIPVSNGIVVFNLPENVTLDTVKYYFMNEKKSGGGDVQDIEDHLVDGYCIVYFEDVTAVARVCEKKKHILIRSADPITVQPYNSHLGLPAECEILSFKLPEAITLQAQNMYMMKFLKENKTQKSQIQSELKKLHADICWDENPVAIYCTLTNETKNGKIILKTWTEDVLKLIKDFTDVLEVKEMNFEGEAWNDVKDALLIVHLDDPDGVALIPEKDHNRLVVVAHKALITEAFKRIQSVVNEAENKFRDRKSAKKEVKVLDAWKVKYLEAAGFKTEMQSEHRGLEVDFEHNDQTGKIIIKGPGQITAEVLIQMYERLKLVQTQSVDLCEEKAKIMGQESTIRYIRDLMVQQHLPNIWEFRRNHVVLHADVQADLKKMEDLIDSSIVKFTIDLDLGSADLLNSKKWKDTEKALLEKNEECVVISKKKNKLEIYTRADIRDKVSKDLEQFLKKNVVYKEQCPFPSPIILCFQSFLKNPIDKELADLKAKGVNLNVTFDKGRSMAFLEGTSEGMKEGKGMLKKLAESIKSEDHTVKHRKVRVFLAREQGNECLKNVERSVPCVIHLGGVGFKSSIRGMIFATNKFERITECAEANLDHNVKIVVIGGDITQIKADILVNAANQQLKHVGGLAAAFIEKGGHDIQKECDSRLKRKGSLQAGDVFLSKGGALQCRYVAHAVGPHWTGGGNGEEAILQKAVLKCLEKSEKNGAKSIAMPALSSGIFGFPNDKACLAIVKAISQHFQNVGEKTSLKTVMLSDINQVTVNAFTAAVQQVLPAVKIMVDIGRVDGPKPSWVLNTNNEEETEGTIEIQVVKDVIVQEKVDVVVNSASSDLQLNRGASSKALLQAGGHIIQQECSQNYSNGITVGEVAVTNSGNLACSKIFHIALKHYDRNNPHQSMKGIKSCITSCLVEASRLGFSSISFPAMGTGAQRYPKDKVAREMFRTVTSFSKTNPASSVRSVRFVIYTDDDETFEVFLTEEKNWIDGGSRPKSRNASSGSSRNAADSGFGQLTNESPGRAEFKFGHVTLSMYEGDITEEDTTAIVASCNLDLDLSKGAVTKALLRKGGDAIEKDCKAQKDTMRKDGVAVTTAGNLKTKYIIHVDTKYKTWEWKPVVLLALRKAEKHKLGSIAFPALGTSVGCKPEELSHVVHSAIAEFNSDNPSHLKEIRMVIFQKEMLTGFIDGMKSAVKGRPGSVRRNRSKSQERPRIGNLQRKHHEKQDHQDDQFTFTVYGESKEKISFAKSKLEKSIKDIWCVRKVEDKGIHLLKFKNIKDLNTLAEQKHVELTIDNDLGVIEMIGLQTDIMDVNDKIFHCLRLADKSVLMRNHAQMVSKMVQWIYLKDQKEYPFPSTVNLEIETAYKQKTATVKIKDRSGGEYEIDFGTMEECDVNNPKAKFPVIRRDFIQGASFEIPKSWRSMKENENLILVQLNPNDHEYKTVLRDFESTLSRKPNIAKIERIQNKTLYAQYAAKRKELEMNNPKQKNERVLWHGTAHNSVVSINSHGFNRSYCGKNAVAIGEGVYFAVQSSYSDQPTYTPPGSDGNKRMYRCLVLTGRYCNGHGGMRVPPPIDASKPHILYDSVTNNTSNPIMFVVFNDTSAYPEHLITYR